MRASYTSLSVWIILSTLIRSSTAQVIYEDLHLVPSYLKAHGIVMSLVFAIMLPIGVILIRFCKGKNAVWIHVGWQTFSWVLMIAGLASGIRVGKILDRLHNNTHTVLGTVVIVLLFLQPFIGLIHHFRWRKTHERGIWTHAHVWSGRVLIVLGIINGSLGLKLAANTTRGEAAYGAVGGFFGVAVIVLIVLLETKRLPRWAQSKAAPEQEMGERAG